MSRRSGPADPSATGGGTRPRRGGRLPSGALPAALAMAALGGVAAFLLPPAIFAALLAAAALVLAWLLAPEAVIILLLLLRSSVDGFMELFTLSFSAGLPLSMNLAGATNSLAVGLGMLCLLRRLLRRQPLFVAAPAWTYALFLLLCLPTIPGSADPTLGIKEWARLGSGLAIFLLTADVVHDEQHARRFTLVMLASSLLPLALAWLQRLTGSGYFFLGSIGTEFAYRPQGTLAHPGILGSYLVVLLTLGVTLYFSERSRPVRAALLGWALVAAGALILTLARTEWLGFLVAMSIVGLVKRRRLALLVLAGALLLLAAVPLLRERLMATDSVYWRLDLWQAAIDLAWPPTLLGLGLGTSPLHINLLLPNVDTPPHNDYLKVLIETGLLGLLAYAAWLVTMATHAGRAYPLRSATGCRADRWAVDPVVAWRALGLLAVVLAGGVMSLSDNYLGHTAVQWYVWAYVALVPANGRWPVPTRCPPSDRPPD